MADKFVNTIAYICINSRRIDVLEDVSAMRYSPEGGAVSFYCEQIEDGVFNKHDSYDRF